MHRTAIPKPAFVCDVMGIQTFPRDARLLTARDYKAVFEQCHLKSSHRYGMVLARRTERHNSRLGVVVSKKNVRRAVDRNRIKRAVREYFRKHPLAGAYDLVFLARPNIQSLDSADLAHTLGTLWQRLEKKNEDVVSQSH